MTTAVMTDWIPEKSPRAKARMAGVFYLLCVVTGIFAIFANAGLTVSGDAAKTAANILKHETLYRAGFAAGFIAAACYVAVAGLFYGLFKPVNRNLSLIAAFFNILGCAVGGVSGLFSLAPFVLLGNAPYLNVFKPEQLQAMNYAFLQFADQASNVGLIFFGFYCTLIGYLIIKSTFLPRFLGALVILTGLSYLTFIWPPLATALNPYSLLTIMLGELGLTIWLLAAGVNADRWNEVAAAAGLRRS